MFLAGEGWWMEFESNDQSSWSSEVERNPKMSISFLWLERGGRWGSSPSTSPANHQELNVIQKWAFHFFGWREVADGVQVHWPARLIIRSWTYSKNEHFIFFGWRGVVDGLSSVRVKGWWMDSSQLISPGNHQKLNVIQKRAFSFFWLEMGCRWGSSPSTSPANHQKLNVIQKWAFHFFGWREVVDGVQVHRPARPIIRSWM